jgi:hypothetical protein
VAEQPPVGASRYGDAIAQVRAAAQWLAVAFGAVGASVIAGLQLSQLGGLDEGRFWGAVLSVVVALAGVAAAIWAASEVLLPIAGTPTALRKSPRFDALRKAVRDDPGLLDNVAGNLDELLLENESARQDLLALWKEAAADPENERLRLRYADAQDRVDQLAPIVSDVTGFGIYLHRCDLFTRARKVMLIGALVAVGGAIGFAYFANPSKPNSVATTSVDCPAYYLQLDSLADDEPNLSQFLRSGTHNSQPDALAQVCGFHTNAELSDFVASLAPR